MAKRAQDRSELDWRTIIKRIKAGKCTPVISYRASTTHFTRQDQVVAGWAKTLGYPMADAGNLRRVAQYAATVSPDMLSAKENYLDFLKERLLDKTKGRPAAGQEAFLETLEQELDDLNFSTVAARLGYPRCKAELDNPLRILAELPLPIYLTTNYCTFMEDALKAAGKAPRTEICFWHEDLQDDVESVFEAEPDYEPSEAEPLVYHVHGLDAYPASLVITEDDYLDFLVNISQDVEAIPGRVAQALADSSLMLLGYQLQEWEFRVIFRGLITARRASRRLMSVTIQLTPEKQAMKNVAQAREYLVRYFKHFNFEIYWGDTQTFMQELWQQWQR